MLTRLLNRTTPLSGYVPLARVRVRGSEIELRITNMAGLLNGAKQEGR